MSVTLTPQMAALIAKAVETGEYATTSEVIREALRESNQAGACFSRSGSIFRSWAEGIASDPGRFKDIEAIKEEARRRLAAEKPASGN